MTNYWQTKPPFGTEIDFSHSLARGLVGYWPFNEGAGLRVNDLSGCGNHGTLTNFEPWASDSGWCGGLSGTALQFDGTNDYVDISNNNRLNITDRITVSAWVYTTSASDQKDIMRFGYSAGLKKGLLLHYNITNQKIQFRLGNGTSTAIATSNDAASLAIWEHYTGTYNGSTVQLYKNGVAQTSISTLTPPISYVAGNLMFGGNVATTYFNGRMDKVLIWNRALSSVEIKRLYLNPYEMFRKPKSSKIPFLKI